MQILQVEDSPLICQLYSDLLESRNHSVEAVNDGKKGLELVMKNDYDLILLDMLMPKYSGMQFLKDLKEKRPSELKKVIVISQLEFNEDDYQELLDFGIRSIQKKTLDLVKFEDKGELEVKHDLV
ncbi:MAG: response regulator [Thaumarchaeota archaeon]|nr:response regulator [Nitrososphaerota archaeon]